MKKQATLNLFTLLGVTIVQAQQQLPSDYISKIQYQEKVEVIYEMVDDSTSNCLTLGELSRYHSYWSIIDKTELVDDNGELHFQDVYVEEKDVRDDWMEGYGRVYAGPVYTDVYSKNETLINRDTAELDTLINPLTVDQALVYGIFYFDDSTIYQIKQLFDSVNIPNSITNGVFIANTTFTSYLFDENSVTTMITEYDTLNSRKLKEHTRHYELNDENHYFPESEIIIEWILTKNGCCVKRTTFIHRSRYAQVVHPDYQNTLSQATKEKKESTLLPFESAFSIQQLTESDHFVVLHKKNKAKPINIKIYDLSGRLVADLETTSDRKIKIPETTQTGMYLVHVYSKNEQTPTVGKIIISSSNNTF